MCVGVEVLARSLLPERTGPRPQRGQRPSRRVGWAPGPAGADGEFEVQQHRPGSPVGACGSLQRGAGGEGGGPLPVVSKGEPWKGSRWLRSASGDWRRPSKVSEA